MVSAALRDRLIEAIKFNNERCGRLIEEKKIFKTPRTDKNRYYSGAHEFSNTEKFIRAVRHYVSGDNISETARSLKVSRPSVANLYQKINDRLIESRFSLFYGERTVVDCPIAAAYHYMYHLKDGFDAAEYEVLASIASVATDGIFHPAFDLNQFYHQWDRRPEIIILKKVSSQMKGIPPNLFPGYFIMADILITLSETDKSLLDKLGHEDTLMRVVLGILREFPINARKADHSSSELMALAIPVMIRHRGVRNVDEELKHQFPSGITEMWAQEMKE